MSKDCESPATTIKRHKPLKEITAGELMNESTNRREYALFDDSNDVVNELKQHLTLFAELANYYNRKFIDVKLQGMGYANAESIKTNLLNAMYEVSEIVASETAHVYFWNKVRCDI